MMNIIFRWWAISQFDDWSQTTFKKRNSDMKSTPRLTTGMFILISLVIRQFLTAKFLKQHNTTSKLKTHMMIKFFICNDYEHMIAHSLSIIRTVWWNRYFHSISNKLFSLLCLKADAKQNIAVVLFLNPKLILYNISPHQFSHI